MKPDNADKPPDYDIYKPDKLLERRLEELDARIEESSNKILPLLHKALGRFKELTTIGDTLNKNSDLQAKLEKFQREGLPQPKDDSQRALFEAHHASIQQFIEASRLEMGFMEVQREFEDIMRKMPLYKEAAHLITRFRQVETHLRKRFSRIRWKSRTLRVALFALALFAAFFSEIIVSQGIFKALLDITLPDPYRPFLSLVLFVLTFLFARYAVEPRLQQNADVAYTGLVKETGVALEEFNRDLDDLALEGQEPNDGMESCE